MMTILELRLSTNAKDAGKRWDRVRVCNGCLCLANLVHDRHQRLLELVVTSLLKEKIRETLIRGELRDQDGGDFGNELCSDLQAEMRALQEGSDDGLDQGSYLGPGDPTGPRR
jgi:hypothetical protein